MKFLLIMMFTAMGGTSINTWDQPTTLVAEFDDLKACESAAARVSAGAKKLSWKVAYGCMPKSSGTEPGEIK